MGSCRLHHMVEQYISDALALAFRSHGDHQQFFLVSRLTTYDKAADSLLPGGDQQFGAGHG